jgi:hypothetical protein
MNADLRASVSVVPAGLDVIRYFPGTGVPGYCRLSLRDKVMMLKS